MRPWHWWPARFRAERCKAATNSTCLPAPQSLRLKGRSEMDECTRHEAMHSADFSETHANSHRSFNLLVHKGNGNISAVLGLALCGQGAMQEF